MRTTPKQTNLQAVSSGGHNSCTPIEVPRRQAHDVLPEYDIGLRKTFEKPVVNHGLSALCRLLPWLKHWHQRSMPLSRLLENSEVAPIKQATCMPVPQAGA